MRRISFSSKIIKFRAAINNRRISSVCFEFAGFVVLGVFLDWAYSFFIRHSIEMDVCDNFNRGVCLLKLDL